MANTQPSTSSTTPTVLIPELLSFSPHFLLDDMVNIANDGVGRAVDAMEDFLNRWAEARLQREPDWDAEKDLEQGLVAFQTLLEFHADIAFDFFEAWSLRNIFVVPDGLPLVAPHHAGLSLDQPANKEAELLAEIDELRRQVDNQRRLRSLLKKASRTAARHRRQAQKRLDHLSFIQPDQLRILLDAAGDVDSLYSKISALAQLEPVNADIKLPEPGKREWETGKAGYLNWANAQLVQRAKQMDSAPGASSLSTSAEEVTRSGTKEEMNAALEDLERRK
ncbi:Mis12 protein-domain-containing protein [Gloeopeniophorella convolvens]|nr:Mis12 protein-domain-containing protein [Gloeopeniophorella convolvens]